MNWDDFQVFRAAARAGSIGDAAKALDVGYTTVSRRIALFEKQLGAALFLRQHGGLTLTTEGEAVLAASAKMSTMVSALEREMKGINKKLEGEIVVSLSPSILCGILMPQLPAFHARHPDIHLEFDTSREFRDILKGEADIAIRLTDNHEYRVPENLLGLRLPDIYVHAYAAKALAARLKKGRAPDKTGWIRWDRRINFGKMKAPFDSQGWADIAAIDDLMAQQVCARSGMGIAILPCFLGDVDPALSRIDDRVPPLAALDAWVLAHPDMRNVERIRAFMQFAAKSFDTHKALIHGQRPRKKASRQA